MNPQAEAKLKKFIDEQMSQMEDSLGPLAQKYKPHFGENTGAYFKWLNMSYQLKVALPYLNEDKLSPTALSQPLGQSEGFKF
mgnify:FL=1